MKKEDTIRQILEEIFNHLKEPLDVEIAGSEDDVYEISILGEDLNFLIGYRGQSLEALQNILSMALYRQFDEYTTIVLDINGYRKSKADRIKNMARKYIDKVRFLGSEVELPRMNPWERRQVHMLVSEYDDIESKSTGERSERRVVLKPKS